MADESTPAIAVATRGMVKADIAVRTAERDLHSGLYGGAVPTRRTCCWRCWPRWRPTPRAAFVRSWRPA